MYCAAGVHAMLYALFSMSSSSNNKSLPSFDSRGTLTREEARDVYDACAEKSGEIGGNDVDSGYGGPAISALLEMADFASAKHVLEYGTGQGKLAELVLSSESVAKCTITWRGIDQSPKMVQRFNERCVKRFSSKRCSIELLESGNPRDVNVESESVDRFVSTYCLDLMSEEDMFRVLELAEQSLCPENGLLLLAGITWGYRMSVQTFAMTAVWEVLYKVWRKKVGGCRPQELRPYLEALGWRIEKFERTLPNGYPWMASEVICARPPLRNTK